MKNADQHFVPQFYLRRFSLDASSVGTFIPPNRFVERASIKGQAQRRYMYGRAPELEKLFGQLEGQWSALLRSIDDKETLPPVMSNGHRDLLFFVALQRGRTTSAATDHEEAFSLMKYFKQRADAAIGKNLPRQPELSYDQHVLSSLQIHLSAWPYLLDLQPLVLVNNSAEAFIASDAPVSFHNDALFDLKHGGATAYSSPGLVAFLPISPIRAVLLFDRNMYSTRLRSNQLVIHPSLSDVSSLNALTAANATRVLYYSSGQPHEEILAAYTMAKRVRALQRNVTFETIVKERVGQRRVLAISPSCAQLSMKLSFLWALPKRVEKMRRILTHGPFPRHPALACWLEAHEEANGDTSKGELVRALREDCPDLYSELSAGRRAFLGEAALNRMPRIRKDILRAFAR